MAERLKMKQLQTDTWGYFSWGIVGGEGIHITWLKYALDGRNWRIKNGALTPRDGFYAISEDPETLWAKKIRGITDNQALFVVCDKMFYEVNVDTGAWTELSSMWNRFTNDVDIEFINFWKYTICFSWDDYPRVWDNVADTRTKLTSSNIESWSVPRFGAKFAYWTYVAWWWAKSNILYISRGVTTTNPQYAYDWVWSWSEKLETQSNIESIVSNRERLYIFTEESIEIITTNSLASVGSVTTTYAVPIAWKNRVGSHRSVVVADNIIMFLTKENEIKTIAYFPWITEADIGNLSNRQWRSIQSFMSTLDVDQSGSFGYFHKEKKLVKWHLREKGYTFNNIILVYDITNDERYIDDNKYFSCSTEYNWVYYTWSDVTAFVYIDEIGGDDDGWPVTGYRNWAYWCPWLSNVRSEYREAGYSGQIGVNTSINVDVLVDDVIEKAETIIWNDITTKALWSEPVGKETIAWEYADVSMVKFEKTISPWNLRARGKMIHSNISWSWLSQQFALSWLSIGYLPLWDTDKADKL